MPLMTKDEFISYAHGVLSHEALCPLYETISEHNGEVAAFGDSWPGALRDINSSIVQVKNIERQLARLEHRQPRDFMFRVSVPR